MSHSSKHHKNSFEDIYKKLPEVYRVRFPLVDIDKIDWNRDAWSNPYYNYFYRRFTAHILSRLDIKDGYSILIVGCGFGLDEKNIKHLFPNTKLWSVDISEEMLKRAARSGSPSKFSLGMAEKLPFPDNCFDRVLSREVIEHVMEPQSMLNEIARVLKPGGKTVITTVNAESLGPTNYYDQVIYPRMAKIVGSPQLVQSYKDDAPTLNEIRTMAEKSALSIEEIIYDGALYHHLISLNNIFRNKLATMAHYFSCLENNERVAFLFCDQVKYVFSKSFNNSSPAANKVFYVNPSSREILHEDEEGNYTCIKTGEVFPMEEGIIKFLLHVNPDFKKEISQDKTYLTFLRKSTNRLFSMFRMITRKLYCTLYTILAFSISIFMKKNNEQLTMHINKKNMYIDFILKP